jgi:hypothetical protein
MDFLNYVNIWAVIKKISVAEAEADPECKLAYDIQFPPVVVSEAIVEPVVVEPPKKRAYKRKPKVVLTVAEGEPTVECEHTLSVAEECEHTLSVAEECVVEPEPVVEPTVEPVVEPTVEPTLSVAEEPLKYPKKKRVTRKVLKV